MNFVFYTPFQVITSPYQLDPIATLLLLRLGEKTEEIPQTENKEDELTELQKRIKEALSLDITITPITVFEETEFNKIYEKAENNIKDINEKLKKVEEIKKSNDNPETKKTKIKKLFEEYLKGGGNNILFEGIEPTEFIENTYKNLLIKKEIILLKLFLIKYIMINIVYLKKIPEPEKPIIREKTQTIFNALAYLEGVIEITNKYNVLLKSEIVDTLDSYVRKILKYIIGK